jgi:hypothetical protein
MGDRHKAFDCFFNKNGKGGEKWGTVKAEGVPESRLKQSPSLIKNSSDIIVTMVFNF